jgi:5'-3' exonuclease
MKDKYFISFDTGKINWKNVGLFIKEIAKNEHQLLMTEYNVRKKFDKFVFMEKTAEEKDNILLNSPIIYRADEKYIFPEEPFWEDRYYRALFHIEKTPEDIKRISQNYFEGLEWVYRYYNDECPNWKWKYNYHYPPLFSDLCKFIPENDNCLVSSVSESAKLILGTDLGFPLQASLATGNSPQDGGAVSSTMQLCYVLPRSNLYLIPRNVEENINKNYLHLYPQNFEFKWAFCRYFWEAHPVLPDISLEILKKIETES